MLLHTADALLCQPLVPWNELKVGSRFPPIHLFLISARMLSCMSFCSCWISLSRSLLSASIPPCKCTMHMIMAYQQIPTRWEYVMMIMGGNDHLEYFRDFTSFQALMTALSLGCIGRESRYVSFGQLKIILRRYSPVEYNNQNTLRSTRIILLACCTLYVVVRHVQHM